MKRYAVVFGKDGGTKNSEVHLFKDDTGEISGVFKECDTLEEALALRQVNGDLVFDLTTKQIVEDFAWLWDYEKEDPTCYARRKIQHKAKLVLDNWFNRHKMNDLKLLHKFYGHFWKNENAVSFFNNNIPLIQVFNHL